MITVKCPNCGARSSTDPAAYMSRCEYCGTKAYVQSRTKYLGRPQKLPQHDAAYPVATQVRSKVLLYAVAPMVVMTVIWGVMVLLSDNSPFKDSATSQTSDNSKQPTPTWNGISAPVLYHVNKDDHLDIIDQLRIRTEPPVVVLAAFNGQDGHKLWQSQPLGPSKDITATLTAVHGVVLVNDGNAGLIGLDLSSGATKWKILLAEKVAKLCAHQQKHMAILHTADELTHDLNTNTGALTPKSASPRTKSAACTPLTTSAIDSQPTILRHKWHNAHGRLVPRRRITGLDISEALHHVSSRRTIGVGCKKPGTCVPMIASYTWAPKLQAKMLSATTKASKRKWTKRYRAEIRNRDYRRRKIAVHWTAVVPAVDPVREAASGSLNDKMMWLTADHFVAAYKTKTSNQYRVTAFDAKSGERKWDILLPKKSPLKSVTATPTRVYVSQWSGLHAFDITTGKPVFVIE